jgi:hypothetical protein
MTLTVVDEPVSDRGIPVPPEIARELLRYFDRCESAKKNGRTEPIIVGEPVKLSDCPRGMLGAMPIVDMPSQYDTESQG